MPQNLRARSGLTVQVGDEGGTPQVTRSASWRATHVQEYERPAYECRFMTA